MPAYNEAATIAAVLDDLYPRVDHVIVVDDGSADGTGRIVDEWAANRERCHVVHFPENRGLSAALRAGWDTVRAMLAEGRLQPDDVCFSIDADGQHEPAAIDGMIEHLVQGNFDCVIGFRDLSYHTPYKVFGNKVMTWIGRLSGGTRFEDIESGYRVFRIGPLLHAQEFYEGYRYSETVEVAVILARMGYRVGNTYRVNIPVGRTRTRLFDAAVDAVCMPLSWYRLACWQDLPRDRRGRYALLAPIPVVLLSALALFLMLLHPFYLGDDSAHSYAHVWYLAESLFTRHELPLHVAQLEDGKAMMFSYGVIPWLPAAILHRAVGDWSVTLSMAVGVVLMLWAMTRFRPALRNPLLFTLALLNPLLWNGITQFQLPTIWSFAFFFLAGAAAGKHQRGRAGLWFALSFAAHPMMGTAAAGLLVLWETVRARRLPGELLAIAGLAAAVASPAFYMMWASPVVSDGDRLYVFLGTVDDMRRLSMVLLPLVVAAWAPAILAHHRAIAGAGAVLTAAVLIYLPPSGLWRSSEPRFGEYLARHAVERGSSYRVMVRSDHEDGMVQFMRAGAVLANEFFTESERRQDFASTDGYLCLLASRDVGHVVLEGAYIRRYLYNEPRVLEQLAAQGLAELQFAGADGTVVYTVHPPSSARRSSLRDCHL